ncbi:MAG TPA: dipeptidase [Ktedonobacteraceae bacterium]|nr:dipeptidase [Ktedonobacteraceae bacterium]
MSKIPVIVGHQDTLLSLYLPERGCGRDFFIRSETGHLDLPRAQEGGIGGSFFAVFVPKDPSQPEPADDGLTITETGYRVRLADPVDHQYALRTAMGMAALLFRLEKQSQGQLKVVHNVSELEQCLNTGVHAAILHFEGAEAIDPDLNSLEVFYKAGLRSLGPVWSRPTIFAHGVPFGYPMTPDTGPGLTDLGKELIRACNRLGIMIDLSHLNEQGFWDVANLSEAPLVATHSNVHALCQSTRNLLDKQLDAIKESGGLVGLNFAVYDLRQDAAREADTPLEILLRHIDHLVEHLGIDGVALGTDFDGTKIPAAIKDASGMPVLIDFLREHGYDDAALRKIGYENWLRVLAKTWK